jgi:S1-C subfamily serine protease
VIGYDRILDLAVIKAEYTPDYVFSVVGGSIPKVGEAVFAIGSPAGLEKTVTSGIVSALGRRFLQIGDVIQIDAAVNHGNSGGPVVDAEGRLVGIVFAGIEQLEGLNFAVPSERLVAALPGMLRGGMVARPWLGLFLSETRDGADIVYVSPLSPASDQMVPEGAGILSINGLPVPAGSSGSISSLQDILFPLRPGELVALETSDGRRRVLMTVPRPRVPMVEASKVDTRERLAAPLFGIILAPSSGGLLGPSFLVEKVIRGSVADEAGLSENDPVEINGMQIFDEEGYAYLDIRVKKRRMGYLETEIRLPAALESPDTL